MTGARGALVRLVLLTAVAAIVALPLRALVFSVVARKVDAVAGALADAAQRLPAPRTIDETHDVPLPPPPPVVASAIASTAKSASIAPIAKPAKSTAKSAPAGWTVTRAEVEEAIATKCHGVRATLLRDDDGAPIGLALHRVGPLARFGVAEGDVLVAANGQPLRTPDEAVSALGALKDAKRVAVALRRGDSTYVVTIDVDDAP